MVYSVTQLSIIEYQSKRVLTTQQLAEVYQTDPKNIHDNFSNNRDRFLAGRDYHHLSGEDLKTFKASLPDIIGEHLKYAPNLLLWTERGANRHSKILDTDKAWQQFDLLEETYFQVKKQSPQIPQTLSVALRLAADQAEVIEHQTKQLAEQKPKVVFAESVECSKDTVLVKGLATILNQNGVDIGQNRLFVWLRDNGYLSKRQGKTFNAPTQKSLDLKIMQEKTTTINKPDREPIVTQTPLITGKGQLYFVNKFLSKEVQAL